MNTSIKSGFKRALISGVAGFVLMAGAQAQANQPSGMALGEALQDYASKANLEILFSPDLVANVPARDVPRQAEPKAYLTALLSGTGLTFTETAPSVFVITEGRVAAPAPRDQAAAAAPVRMAQAATPPQPAPAASPSAQPRPIASTTGPDGAAPGIIQGRVIDASSGAALAGARLRIVGTDQVTSTDSRGEYRFAAVPAGEYQVSVDYLGANPVVIDVTVRSREASTQDVTLGFRLETVFVYGNRSSLQQALNQQRAADNAATIVAADLLGSFPAETVSEALRRVPGVAFQRDEGTGEGSRISVRGFNAEAINIKVNGLDLQGTGIERGVDLNGFLADNISQITIQKTLLPSMESSGSGGIVEIETRSGLDYGSGYFSASLEREFGQEDLFGDEMQANMTAAWRFTPKFGVVGTLQYRDTDRTNFDTNFLATDVPVIPAGFTSASLLPERFNFPFDAALPGRLNTGANYFQREREETNLTASLNFAWDVSENTSLRLDLQRVERELYSSTARTTASFLTSSTDMPIPELNNEVRRRTYISGFRPTLGVDEADDSLSITTISFRGDTDLGQWELDYKLGYSETINDRRRASIVLLTDNVTNVTPLIDPATLVTNPDDNAAMTPRIVGGAVGVTGDNIPTLFLTPSGQAILNNPGSYYVSSASFAEARNPSETITAEFSGRYNFAGVYLDYVEGGFKYADNERANSDDVLSNTNLTSNQSYIRITGRNTFLGDFTDGELTAFDLSQLGGSSTIPFTRSGTAFSILNQIAGLTVDDPTTAFNEQRFNRTDRTGDPIVDSNAISPLTIQETTSAAYLQAKATIGKFDITGGFRFEQADRVSSAILFPSIRLNLPGFQNEPRDTFIQAGLIDFVDTSGVEETWTPSLLANYRPNEQMVYRFGYFRTTTNPDIRQIARPPQIFLDLRTGFERATIREANPDLEARTVDNFDLDFSYYFKDNPGLVRVGLFYKKTTNNFTSILLADEPQADLRDRVLEELADLTAIRPDLTALPANTEFFLQRPQNGEGGSIYGVELEVIRQLDFFPETWPTFLNNFSVLGNLTYTTSDFPTLVSARDDNNQAITLSLDRPFADQSEWSGTASVSYEEGPFSGRLIYTYQSEAVRVYDEYNLNTVVPEFDTLDLRLSYTLRRETGPDFVLYFEGDNLLKSYKDADVRSGTGSLFGEGSPDFFFPDSVQFSGGRTFTIGGRVTF